MGLIKNKREKSIRKRIVKAIEYCPRSSENGLKTTGLNDLLSGHRELC